MSNPAAVNPTQPTGEPRALTDDEIELRAQQAAQLERLRCRQSNERVAALAVMRDERRALATRHVPAEVVVGPSEGADAVPTVVADVAPAVIATAPKGAAKKKDKGKRWRYVAPR